MKTKHNHIFALAAAAVIALSGITGCTYSSAASSPYDAEDLDATWSTEGAIQIALSDTGVQVTDESGGTVEDSESGVSDADGIVTISKAGTYILSGARSDGQVIVNAAKEDLVRLIFNGVSVTSSASAPVYVKQAEKVIVTLAEGTDNSLLDGKTYLFSEGTDEPDAALYSQDDLTINGSGSLTVTANYKDGIVSKDDLIIAGGTITVTAAADGLKGKDSIASCSSSITVTAGEDGLKSSNDADAEKGWIILDSGTFQITSGNDGIQAETSLDINGGDFTIVAGGGAPETIASGQDAGSGFQGSGRQLQGRPENAVSGAAFDFAPGGTPGTSSGGALAPPDRSSGGAIQKQGNPGRAASVSGGAVSVPGTATGSSGSSPSSSTSAAALSGSAVTDEVSDSYKGLKAGSEMTIAAGSFLIDSADDAVHANGDVTIQSGTFSLTTGDDGVHSDAALTIDGGSIEIIRSYEGLEGATVDINGGTITLTASDDGVNSAGGSDSNEGFAPASDKGFVPGQASATTSGISGTAGTETTDQKIASGGSDSFRSADSGAYYIRITGGELTVDASGDGLDSNGSLYLDGGTVIVNGPTSGGNSALDYDGDCKITGGTLITAGSSAMAQAPGTDSTQNSLMVYFTETQKAGSTVVLKNSDGSTAASYTSPKDYQSILFSTPDLKLNSTYTLSVDLTTMTEVTLTSTVTKISDDGTEVTGGMGGGMGGGRGNRGGGGLEQSTGNGSAPDKPAQNTLQTN